MNPPTDRAASQEDRQRLAGSRWLRRPRVMRLEPVYSQRLPQGRALVELEIAGWGLLFVGRNVSRYRGPTVRRYLVPAGKRLRVVVLSLTGADVRTYTPDATLAQTPETVVVPAVDPNRLGMTAHLPLRPTAPTAPTFALPALRVAIQQPAGAPRCEPRLPRYRPLPVPLTVRIEVPPVLQDRLRPREESSSPFFATDAARGT